MKTNRRLYELTRLPTLEEIRDQKSYVYQLTNDLLEVGNDADEQNRIAYRLSVEEKRLKRMMRTIR